jgi:hypothetical protein
MLRFESHGCFPFVRPWTPHDMQVGIRRPGPHDVGAGRLVCGRQSGGLRIKRPHNHPVRTDRNGRACRIVRIRITALCCARQHVDKPGSVLAGFALCA